ncbi:ribosome binding protein [Babesia ovata]|uniref:Ribosome binding protein n=1 Tax=Babesia ovata TaxID=189622 RepID=A0A2H6KHZ4_9APIC|nr:ribosome binding protein [Babesia ovata]GBE62616.1 ribosome binding protein [Babesia ovata]
MEAHGVPLGTLKQCLQFLQWLHQSAAKQGEVAQSLYNRIQQYYTANYLKIDDVKKGLSPFLSAVSKFYERLCNDPAAGNYNDKSAEQICSALLECTPKFLAAIYFLEYCINNTFGSLGGGGWEKDFPGWEEDRWYFGYPQSGGDLQRYLRSTVDEGKYHNIPGLLPGGFGKNEVQYRTFWYSYYQGYSMAGDLANIVSKGNYNYFRSVFVTSAVADTGTHRENTANALSLVRTFCDIVKNDTSKDGGSLKAALEAGLNKLATKKSICWDDLKKHCTQLRTKLGTLFNTQKRFDFTGQATETKNLNKDELARHTANWLRENLNQVRGKLQNINTDDSVLKMQQNQLGDYFTRNFFPYGFRFRERFHLSDSDVRALLGDLSSVINELKRGTDGDLDRLKDILNGTYRNSCPDAPKEVVAEKKVPVVPPKKPEVPPAKVPDGTPNQGKKSEGAQNQGKKSEGNSPLPEVKSAVPSQPPSNPGASGPQGPKGPGPSVTSVAASGPTGTTDPAGSPPFPGASDQGQDPSNTAAPSIHPAASSTAVLSQAPSASGSSPRPTVVHGAGQPGGGGAGQQSGKPTSPSADHNSSSVAATSVVPAPGAGGSGAGGAPPKRSRCPNGVEEITVLNDQGYICQPKSIMRTPFLSEETLDDVWESQKKTLTEYKPKSSKTLQSTIPPNLRNPPSRPVPVPPLQPTDGRRGQGRPPVETQERDAEEGSQNVTFDIFADSTVVEDMSSDPMFEADSIPSFSTTGQELPDTLQAFRDGEVDFKSQEALRTIYEHNEKKLYKANLDGFKPHESSQKVGWDEAVDAMIDLDGAPLQDYSHIKEQSNSVAKIQNDLANVLDAKRYRDEQREWEIAQKEKELEEQRRIDEEDWKQKQLMSNAIDQQKKHKDLFGGGDVDIIPRSVRIEDYDHVPTTDIDLRISTRNVHPVADADALDIPSQHAPHSSEPPVFLDIVRPTKLTDDERFRPPDPFQAAVVDMDSFLDPSSVEISQPPEKQNLDRTEESVYGKDIYDDDLYIDVPDRPLQDPYGAAEGFSGLPNTNFDLDFAPGTFGFKDYEDPGIPRDPDRKTSGRDIPAFATPDQCSNPWYVPDSSSATVIPTPSPPPDSDHLPLLKTVREMLYWFVGLNQKGYISKIKEHVEGIIKDISSDASHPSDAIEVTGDPTQLTASHISNTLTQACLYAASVLHKIKHKDTSKAILMSDFSSEYSKLRYSSDPACLLCQLRDYVYACCHQLAFLKSQCNRNSTQGGWRDCQYGRDAKMSPLQAFLTDAPDSKFKTHPFDPRNICCKSRVRMGFREKDLPGTHETGGTLSTILSPICGGNDPLLTLSYLNCLTRRTPRTTGELVSFFHHFGNSLHRHPSTLSTLGSALSTAHDDCPDWDFLGEEDLQAVQDIRGSAPPNSNHNHDQGHPNTLSTLVGCDIDNSNCPQLMKTITYRAYTLYSPDFVHDYLSWTAYLAERLRESLLRLHYDLENLQCHDDKSLHQSTKALPLLYYHGFTPPYGMLQPPLSCSKVIAKLKQVVAGKPIASLMTCMDTFLWHIRAPFLYTIITLWLTATLYILHSLLYRMDVLRIRSHLLTTRASHLVDVKALLAGSRRMLSLYKDVDYFDDGPLEVLDIRK